MRFEFCVSPWTSEIMMWSDGEITQLTENLIEPNAPAINNVGQIAFTSKEPTDEGLQRTLKLWEDGTIEQLSDWGSPMDINDDLRMPIIRWHSDTGN